MSTPADPKRTLGQRATKRLAETATRLLNRAHLASPTTADLILLDTQHAAYVQLHQRFIERASRGEAGIGSGLEALDAMWETVRVLRGVAPTALATLSSVEDAVQARRGRFYIESTELLEDAIRVVLATDLRPVPLPPERLAVLVRVVLEGLVVELAQARDAEDVARVDQAYLDLRLLFERFMGPDAGPVPALTLDPIALPW